MSAVVIVVDDDKNFLEALDENARLRKENERLKLKTFEDPRIALQYFRENGADVVVTDVLMAGMNGMELFNTILNIDKSVPVIIISAYATVQKAVEAVEGGAYYYFEKPVNPEIFWKKIQEAIYSRQFKQLKDEREAATPHTGFMSHVHSEVRKGALRQIEKVQNTPTTVFLTGERGTGKRLVAKAIHGGGERKNRPFIIVNCSAPSGSEPRKNLFDPDVDTNIQSRENTLIKKAGGGVLYLEEIGALTSQTQAELARYLWRQSTAAKGEGFNQERNPQIIVSSSLDIDREFEEGRFNRDLYWQINVFRIYIPPLRETTEDIYPLAKYFLKVHERKLNKTVDTISYNAMTRLLAYSWPGNILELENVIESAMVGCEGGVIRERDLSFVNNVAAKGAQSIPTLKEAERKAIVSALQYAEGQIKQAAYILGIHRNTLTAKMKELGITEKSWNLKEI